MSDANHLRSGTAWTATEKDCAAPWSGHSKNFRCNVCGYKFMAGDTVYWVYTNDMPDAGGNPLLCEDCGVGGVLQRRALWARHCEEWRLVRKRFWKFINEEA